jgi:hypothetical protein
MIAARCYCGGRISFIGDYHLSHILALLRIGAVFEDRDLEPMVVARRWPIP